MIELPEGLISGVKPSATLEDVKEMIGVRMRKKK